MGTTFKETLATSSFPNLTDFWDPPVLVQVGPEAIVPRWRGFVRKHRIQLVLVLLYFNRARTGKLWPASEIVHRAVTSEEYEGQPVFIDSTSGGFGLANKAVLDEYKERKISCPVERFIAVVPRSMPKAKRLQLEAQGIELIDADDAAEAMQLAAQHAKENNWFYTCQYKNPANCDGYRRPARHLARAFPNLGAFSAGLGSTGCFTGVTTELEIVFADREFGLFRVGDILEPDHKIGGVREMKHLELGSDRYVPHLDQSRYIAEDRARSCSAALWMNRAYRCLVGESTGFAVEGGLLGVQDLVTRKIDHKYRAPDGTLYLAVTSTDPCGPYRENFERAGHFLPDELWEASMAD